MPFDRDRMDYRSLRAPLITLLEEYGLDQSLIDDVLDSGYFLRDEETRKSVGDFMYGNKVFSSNFEIEKFVAYANGKNTFPPLPDFQEFVACSRSDIDRILSDERRTYYIKDGALTFRGQTRQYSFRRKVPNPVRADNLGAEISVFPGIYRQNSQYYSFDLALEEKRTLEFLLHRLEPDNPEVYRDSTYAYDVMRTEQHYATQTRGLDLTFDIDVATFFATHRFESADGNRARYNKVPAGNHEGVIYCFRFVLPFVKKTEFFIKEFDLFKTNPPERILRQQCGLPLIGDFERNIAICDIDCIIKLDKDFDGESAYDPAYLFPPASADPFYARLLELKDQYPTDLHEIVEYEWARH